MRGRTVYMLITAVKVHLYGSHARCLAVAERARRRGVKVEYTSNTLKMGATEKMKMAAERARFAWDHTCALDSAVTS